MWPDDIEAQSYLVLLLLALVIDVSLLWTVLTDRRHYHRREARLRAAQYDAEARAIRAERAAERSFDEHVATVPTLVSPVVSRSGSWPAITSIVVDTATDPDATTRIYIGDDGRDMT